MANLFARFTRLLPADPLLVGEVTAHNGDGTSTVALTGGGVIRARGQSVAVGTNAFVRKGEVAGEAPALDSYTVDV